MKSLYLSPSNSFQTVEPLEFIGKVNQVPNNMFQEFEIMERAFLQTLYNLPKNPAVEMEKSVGLLPNEI